jgi:diacylglycerol kinase (ATP)
LIGLISNRNSGHNRDQFEHLCARLDDIEGAQHQITESVADIAPALIALRDAGCEYLAINGGDGTVSAILGQALELAIFEDLPPVLILPAGTANMTASDVGIRGKLTTAVEKLQRWHRGEIAENRTERVLMRVSLDPESAPHYGMFLGAGAVIQGTEYAHREIHSRGLRDNFSGALGVLRTAWGLARNDPQFATSVAMEIELAEAHGNRHHEVMLLAVSSLKRLFMGMDPFWGAGPGRIRISIIEGGCGRFLRTFQSIARGKANSFAIPENGYLSFNSDEITIQMDGKLNLDGEILTTSSSNGPVRISASKPVTFIRL